MNGTAETAAKGVVVNALHALELTESFLAVAEELNFRRSAERLNIDQSALTRRIQKLELILGFALFERTTREVSLTPAGRAYYLENTTLVHSFLNSVSAARLIAEGKTGSLRIAYMTFVAPDLMPRAVAQYKARHPHIDVTVKYMRTQGQKLALARDEIDAGYMIGPFEHSEYHAVKLRTEQLFVVAPIDHSLARQEAVSPVQLNGEGLILGNLEEWEAYRWQIERLLAGEGVTVRIELEASNTLALAGLVGAGLGVTICPQSLVGYFGPHVVARPIAHPEFKVETVLVWKRTKRTKALAHFVGIAKKTR